MKDVEKSLLAQLDAVISLYETSHDGDYTVKMGSFNSAAMAAIDRVSGPNSAYSRLAQAKVEGAYGPGHHKHMPYLSGIIRTLRDDLAAGFLVSVAEIIHGEVFGNFLEAADHLLDAGYKDAAAVMAGGVLEVHLRNLCTKNGIEVDSTSGTDIKPKRADQLNSDLKSAGIYSVLGACPSIPKFQIVTRVALREWPRNGLWRVFGHLSRPNSRAYGSAFDYSDRLLDQKSVTAWLDLRNKAAHAKYNEYEKGQVALMLQGIRDFISRKPA